MSTVLVVLLPGFREASRLSYGPSFIMMNWSLVVADMWPDSALLGFQNETSLQGSLLLPSDSRKTSNNSEMQCRRSTHTSRTSSHFVTLPLQASIYLQGFYGINRPTQSSAKVEDKKTHGLFSRLFTYKNQKSSWHSFELHFYWLLETDIFAHSSLQSSSDWMSYFGLSIAF